MKLAVYLIFILSILSNLYSQKLIIGFDEWEPYQFIDQNKKLAGIDIEITEAVMKKAGLNYEFQNMPWKRQLEELKSGRLSIALGASISPDREEFAYFSIPYRTESVVLFLRKNESKKYKYKTIKEFLETGFRLGITRGYYYGDEFEKYLKDPTLSKFISEVEADDVNFKKLLANRIDGFLADPFVGSSGLKKQGNLQYIEIYPMNIYSDNIHFMISKKGVEAKTFELINSSIDALLKDGTIKKILDKYLK